MFFVFASFNSYSFAMGAEETAKVENESDHAARRQELHRKIWIQIN